MNASLVRQLIDTTDEVRELMARVAMLEEAIGSLRVQLVAVRNHSDDIEEGLLERRVRS